MQKFLAFIFSRQMLAFVAMIIFGLLIWFVGPMFSFGGLKPLETIGMRVTTILLLCTLVLCLLLSWSISVVGMTALCLLIWHGGPLLAIGAVQPFGSVGVRALVVGLIIFCYMTYGLYRLWQALRSNEDLLQKFLHPGGEAHSHTKEDIKAVSGIVQRAMTQLKSMRTGAVGIRRLFEGKRYLYELPWYMVLGSPGVGKTTAILNSGLKFPLAEQLGAASEMLAVQGRGGTAHCDWWFTNEAVLIDTAGRYTTHDSDKEKDPAEWHGFLGLLRKYRARAPINGAILTVSVVDLLLEDEAARMSHAAKMRERLAELRRELGICFPVYVIVTKLDLIEGFNEYFQSLTSEGRAQVWGVTLPLLDDKSRSRSSRESTGKSLGKSKASGNDLRKQVEAELAKLAKRIEGGLDTRLQEEFEVNRRRKMYALPQEFSSLSQVMVPWTEAVFFDSRYDNTQLSNTLRGIYFTSAAQASKSLAANSLTLWQRLKRSLANNMLASLVAKGGGNDEAMISASADSLRNQMRLTNPVGNRSFFLNDLFTKLIIPEAYLVRPNLRWEFRFKLLHMIGHTLCVLLTLWLISALTLSFGNNLAYLQSISDKASTLKIQVDTLFTKNNQDLLNGVSDTLTAAQELPQFQDLDLADPALNFTYGLYSADTIVASSTHTYHYLQDHLLLPHVIHRMEKVLTDGMAAKDSKKVYDTLRVYLQLHDKEHYSAEDTRTWVVKDWESGELSKAFGGKAAMVGHVQQLFSGERVVQSPFSRNDSLVTEARRFLDTNTSSQRLYERAKSSMMKDAPDEFTLTRAVGPQAGTVFARASGQPLEKGIPGIFTYEGYHNLFTKRLPEYIAQAQQDDAWVMGRTGTSTVNGGTANATKKTVDTARNALADDALTTDIRRQYLIEYADLWAKYLEDIRTVTGSNLTFDLTVLRAFAAPDSPLSRLARAAARETTLSRPLVSEKAEEDKNLFDKANEQLDKKQKEISKNVGLRPEQRLERELVDTRFAALREMVTGQADAGGNSAVGGVKAGLENVSAMLNEYYTVLTVANTALIAASLPSTGTEAGQKLRLEADKLPAPFRAILNALADSGTEKVAKGSADILRSQAQIQVDRLVGLLAYQVSEPCKRGIEGRYPFAPSNQDVSIDDFTRVFAAGGAADEFFQKQLAQYVDTSVRPWKYKNPATVLLGQGTDLSPGTPTPFVAITNRNQPTLLGETLKLLEHQGPNPDTFAKMQAIREVFFRELGSHKMAWKVDVKVVDLDPSITELVMNFDGQGQSYAHGPVQTLTVNWPGPRGGVMAELSAIPRIRQDTSTIVSQGSWALFRLLERAKLLNTTSPGRTVAEFSFDGRKAVLDLNTGGTPNPLMTDLIKGFHCPGRLQ